VKALVDLDEKEGLLEDLDFALLEKTYYLIKDVSYQESTERSYYMAKLLYFLGKPEEALSLYKKCIEQPRPTTEFWRARIQVGMGQAALSLNRNDVALASLKSADALLHDQPLCKNYSPRLFFKQIYKGCLRRC